MDWAHVGTLALADAALVLAAAKAHGRQVRLEREQHGIRSVSFRDVNDPFVEDLWRKDRARLWATSAALALAIVAFHLVHAHGDLAGALGGIAQGLVLAIAGGFFAAGVASLWRLADRDEAGWSNQAIGASFLWWTLVALLVGVAAGLGS